MSKLIFVISGPSGVGKSTIIGRVIDRVGGLAYSISHTSRSPRGNEKDGIHYHFLPKEEFLRLIEKGDFAEWAEVYGDYYGTSFSSLEGQMTLGSDIIMDVDIKGAENLKKRFPESIGIYILPPTLTALEERLRGRGSESAEAFDTRFKKAFEELSNCFRYDYIVFNEDLSLAVKEVEAVVLSERCRSARQTSRVLSNFQISPPPGVEDKK